MELASLGKLNETFYVIFKQRETAVIDCLLA